MAFIIEDGTGKEDSNSYVTVQEFKDYFLDRGQDFSAIGDSTIQPWLILSTEYCDMNYKYVGYRSSSKQALDWPRVGAIDKRENIYTSSDIPVYLKNAVCELALAVKQYGTLEYDNVKDRGLKSKSMGPLSVTYNGSGGSEDGQNERPRYTKAENWLSYIITPNQLLVSRV